jgi:hypothetical protein
MMIIISCWKSLLFRRGLLYPLIDFLEVGFYFFAEMMSLPENLLIFIESLLEVGLALLELFRHAIQHPHVIVDVPEEDHVSLGCAPGNLCGSMVVV